MIKQNQPLVISTPKGMQPYAPPVDVIEPREIIENLWRKRAKIFSIVTVVMVLTAIILSMVTPRYTAETLIMIDSRGSNIVDFDSVFPGLSLDNEAIASEIEIIKSRDLAEKVVDRLDLLSNPEFNSELRPKSGLAEFFQLKRYIPQGLLDSFTGDSSGTREEQKKARERTLTVNAFMDGLVVSRKGDSRVINIQYTSEDPDMAARIVNTIADLYIAGQLEAKYEATRSATKWLNERVEPLREKVRESETAIEQFRQRSGLTESKGITLNSQQMAELSTQLVIAQTDYTEAQARLRRINQLMNTPGAAESAPEVLNSSLIQSLRVQEAELERRIGELSTELGERHPTMVQLRAELGDLRSKIRSEVRKIVSGIKNEAEIARVRKASLEANLNKLKGLDAENNKDMVELHALEREAEADQKLLEVLLSRLKETTSQEGISNFQPDARVISFGNVPISPSHPKKIPILALMLFASTIVAVLYLSVSESSDQGFRSCEEIELQTGLPSLGFLPVLQKGWPERKPESMIMKRPESNFAESVRTLYSSTLLASSTGKVKSLLVTSAETGEGTTTIASCLARTRALAGDKTLIVDLNLRNPDIHRTFDIKRSPGIIELLSGDFPLEEIVRRDPESGADIITAGAACLNPTDILMGHNLGTLIHILSDKYDFVIIDSAPIMAYPDTRLLLDKVDTTVFVVRWAQTKRKFVQKALAQITASRKQLVGVVLNMVDVKKYSQYGYRSSGYYYGQLKKTQTG
ncbi:MAG: polysaccharide biosynthesis tyrosine autokinase [Gammaproteobacteria bacterium]|jgi:capsular exopolysaccharide synthesis family protein